MYTPPPWAEHHKCWRYDMSLRKTWRVRLKWKAALTYCIQTPQAQVSTHAPQSGPSTISTSSASGLLLRAALTACKQTAQAQVSTHAPQSRPISKPAQTEGSTHGLRTNTKSASEHLLCHTVGKSASWLKCRVALTPCAQTPKVQVSSHVSHSGPISKLAQMEGSTHGLHTNSTSASGHPCFTQCANQQTGPNGRQHSRSAHKQHKRK